METRHKTTKLAQHNENKPQYNEINNEISATCRNTLETSHNTTEITQHDGNKLQHKLAQNNENRPQYNDISITQRTQAATQWKQVTTQQK